MLPTKFSLNDRRSTRIPFRIAVRLAVKDAEGTFASIEGWTMVLNKHGARIESKHAFNLQDEVLLTVSTTGKSGMGKVVWVDPKRNANGNLEIGLELEEAENKWGIEFPPNDWNVRRNGNRAEAAAARAAEETALEGVAAAMPEAAAEEPEALTIELDDTPPSCDSFTEAESEAEPVGTLPEFPLHAAAEAASAAVTVAQAPAVQEHCDLTGELLQINRPLRTLSPALRELFEEDDEAAPAVPLISRHMSAESFSAATASLLNALVSLLEKQGFLRREDLYAEMRRFSK